MGVWGTVGDSVRILLAVALGFLLADVVEDCATARWGPVKGRRIMAGLLGLAFLAALGLRWVGV